MFSVCVCVCCVSTVLPLLSAGTCVCVCRGCCSVVCSVAIDYSFVTRVEAGNGLIGTVLAVEFHLIRVGMSLAIGVIIMAVPCCNDHNNGVLGGAVTLRLLTIALGLVPLRRLFV